MATMQRREVYLLPGPAEELNKDRLVLWRVCKEMCWEKWGKLCTKVLPFWWWRCSLLSPQRGDHKSLEVIKGKLTNIACFTRTSEKLSAIILNCRYGNGSLRCGANAFCDFDGTSHNCKCRQNYFEADDGKCHKLKSYQDSCTNNKFVLYLTLIKQP